MQYSKKSIIALFFFTVAVDSIIFIIYWPGLHGNFIFDDFANVVNNLALRSFDGSLDSLIAAATSGTSSPLGRPLSMASFMFNYHFFGEDPFSFKLTNLIIHLVNALLIFVLVLQLLFRLYPSVKANQLWTLSIGVSTVWVLHPMNLTPVLFVVQRMTGLAALFTLVTLILYLHGRQTKGKQGFLAIGISILTCWPAAILSKETGLVLPIYIFLCEWLLLGSFQSVSTKTKWSAIFVFSITTVVLVWLKWSFITSGYSIRNFNLSERLMTEARVLWFYVQQLLLPAPNLFGLFHDDIVISREIISPPSTIFAIICWIAITALALQQRVRRPLFTFAVLWFLVSHLLESTLLPLEIAYEHRNYLASVGLFLWLGSLLWPPSENLKWHIPRIVLASSFILFCCLVTNLRSLAWADEFQRSQVEVSDHPDSARANYQAANIAMQRTYEAGGGNPIAYQMVQYHYKRAADLDTDSKAPLVGLLYLDCSAGVPKNAAIFSRLLERFATTRFTFSDRAVVQSLSAILVENRLCLDATDVKALIDAGLSNPSANGYLRGLIYAVAMDYAVSMMHDLPQGLTYAKAAVASDPGSVALRVNLIYLTIQTGNVAEAKRDFIELTKGPIPGRAVPSINKLKNTFEMIEKNEKNTDKPIILNSVVIPALNEAVGLASLLQRCPQRNTQRWASCWQAISSRIGDLSQLASGDYLTHLLSLRSPSQAIHPVNMAIATRPGCCWPAIPGLMSDLICLHEDACTSVL